MKNLLVIAMLAALGGCAVAPQSQPYGARYGQPSDPSQWRVVSVTPVPLGTGERMGSDGTRTEYSSRPLPSAAYAPAPVYSAPPVYVQEPSYYFPPVSLSLGFIFGRHWSRGHGGAHFHGRRHR